MVANNPLFKDACQALQRAPAGYKPPNRERLRNALLEAEHLHVEQDVSENRKAIDRLGCTMISDGWKDHISKISTSSWQIKILWSIEQSRFAAFPLHCSKLIMYYQQPINLNSYYHSLITF